LIPANTEKKVAIVEPDVFPCIFFELFVFLGSFIEFECFKFEIFDKHIKLIFNIKEQND